MNKSTIKNRIEQRKQSTARSNGKTLRNRRNDDKLNKMELLKREYSFYYGMKYLTEKYGHETIMKWYWKPNYIKNGIPETTYDLIMPRDLIKVHHALSNGPHLLYCKQPLDEHMEKLLLDEFYETMMKYTNEIISRYKKLKNVSFKERLALFRYKQIGALTNISLSVHPDKKEKWGINFELFGSFYNTNTKYCGLFPELETIKCVNDVFHFDFNLNENMNILINPPYTENWIQHACEIASILLEKNTNKNTKIWLVIPVWNETNRTNLGLNTKSYSDMPIIDALKISPYLVNHSVENLSFYNGLEDKTVNLKDKVHVFYFEN